MIPIKIDLNGDGCWPDFKGAHGIITHAAYLDRGTVGGLPSVMLRARLDDGTEVMIETTLRLFMATAAAFSGKAERDGIDCWRTPK